MGETGLVWFATAVGTTKGGVEHFTKHNDHFLAQVLALGTLRVFNESKEVGLAWFVTALGTRMTKGELR